MIRILKSRINYWSCSKFADLIRGEKKPYALELGEWDKWKNTQKTERPWRFWLSDTFLNKLQDIICFPIDIYNTIRIYIRNRYFDKIHYLKTDLIPGDFYDLDTRILHGLFNELVIFVEKELAHLSKWNTEKKYKFVKGRCVDAAYDYFEWANNLKQDGKLTDQAKFSRKLQQLYEWWTIERPNRPDPYVKYSYSKTNKKSETKKYKDISKIEADYESEDTKKLIELIKIRNSFWT